MPMLIPIHIATLAAATLATATFALATLRRDTPAIRRIVPVRFRSFLGMPGMVARARQLHVRFLLLLSVACRRASSSQTQSNTIRGFKGGCSRPRITWRANAHSRPRTHKPYMQQIPISSSQEENRTTRTTSDAGTPARARLRQVPLLLFFIVLVGVLNRPSPAPAPSRLLLLNQHQPTLHTHNPHQVPLPHQLPRRRPYPY
ncbi:hypothetical protein CVT25_002483 [Psilocybe cyanescens]|uniref:Uncharacterized protein n=1 Tax=Psilocybe cyanescens TaxID=93625 RepID=A0A409X4L6_PSICY|nr:hypothetical protein CVT25_002483 [Psilocybe cyanescens]